jgi:hypothetical protein
MANENIYIPSKSQAAIKAPDKTRVVGLSPKPNAGYMAMQLSHFLCDCIHSTLCFKMHNMITIGY